MSFSTDELIPHGRNEAGEPVFDIPDYGRCALVQVDDSDDYQPYEYMLNDGITVWIPLDTFDPRVTEPTTPETNDPQGQQ